MFLIWLLLVVYAALCVCVCVMMGGMCFSFSFWIEILAVMRIVQLLKISVNPVDFLGGQDLFVCTTKILVFVFSVCAQLFFFWFVFFGIT